MGSRTTTTSQPDNDVLRLTALSHGAGCACKLSLDELTRVLDHVAPGRHPDLVVGSDTGDDAAVWRQRDGRLLVATTDFFTPLVDDPYTWGRIAAANAVSDIYAMGAEPRFALNLVGWPRALDLDILGSVLTGAGATAEEAGYPLVGGHTIDALEPFYGQAVIGEVEPAGLLTNAGARPGEALVLTKPLGTGIVTTALKRRPAIDAETDPVLAEAAHAAIAEMTRLNRCAAAVAREIRASAATDVTGFGLLGHLHRLAAASGVACRIDPMQVPVLPGVLALLAEGHVPGGTVRNREQAERYLDGGANDIEVARLTILADAQTSGGLLLSAPPAAAHGAVRALCSRGHGAAVIGSVVRGEPGTIHLDVGAAGPEPS